MLSWIRKRAGSFWAKALYVGVAITFFGGFGLLSSKVKSCSGDETAADAGTGLVMVDGSSISEREFQLRFNQSYNQLVNRLRDQFPDQPIPEGFINRAQLRRDVMKNLIQEKLIRNEAVAMGIEVSRQELQYQIASAFTGGNPSAFDPAQYSAALSSMGMTEAEFEDQVRAGIIGAKVAEAVSGSVSLLPDEIRERYAFDHQPVKIEYVTLDPAVLAPVVAPGETAIKAYYEDHLDRFLLDETRQVEYAAWKIEDLASAVTLTEQETLDYYNQARDRFLIEPEQVKAQHILVKVSSDATPEDIDKARALITKIQDELKQPGADFGALALQYSEDPGSKDKGGDLGFFARSAIARQFNLPAMVEPFENAAFALEVGKISEPVQTDFGFHLIKVSEKRPARYSSLEEVRPAVEAQLRQTKAMDEAVNRAEAVLKAINEGQSFAEAAAAAGDTVQTSPLFQARDEEITGLPDSRAVIEAVFVLNEGEMAGPIKGEASVFLARVVKIVPEHQAGIDEVRDRIIEALKPDLQREAALTAAEALLGRAQSGEIDFTALATEAKSEVKTEEKIRSEVSLIGIVASDTVDAALNSLTASTPWSGPVAAGDRIVVFHLVSAGEPDLTAFETEKDEYARKLLADKQRRALKAWIDGLMKKADIVYSESWKKMEAQEE